MNHLDDAVSEALAYAYEHWDKLAAMANLVGHLFRVGQSRSRARKTPTLFRDPIGLDSFSSRVVFDMTVTR